MTLDDLSDHYPIVMNYTFVAPSTQVTSLNGCKNDNDCSYDILNVDCKCTGDGCTYNDSHYVSDKGLGNGPTKMEFNWAKKTVLSISIAISMSEAVNACQEMERE
eukprot:CAMPEP_0116919516 /NCGR_PEP_ID=MMETSP0467-20121206/20434_1 /TAXON_ID=283647 /ORGANISM="Mesodinium pulex, Strain SPMC105" /LENGTH=104 /DNA_ID=CAMNT_0004597113 /DNA_START=1247 /DNA_END=1562 /DNA_ORIENTATION=-